MVSNGLLKMIFGSIVIFASVLQGCAWAEDQAQPQAQILDQAQGKAQVTAVADSVMDDIAAKIAAAKNKYMVLSNFDPASLVRNDQGYKELNYAYPLGEGRSFNLNVAILPLDAKEKEIIPGRHVIRFPLAGVKLLWSTRGGSMYLGGLGLGKLIQDVSWSLEELQQKQLPLAFSIVTSKESYVIGEKIGFELVLKNVSGSALRVYGLGSDSASCMINDQSWGSEEVTGRARDILEAGQEMRDRLNVDGLEMPGDFRITCFYSLGFKGIRPEAFKIIKVTNKP